LLTGFITSQLHNMFLKSPEQCTVRESIKVLLTSIRKKQIHGIFQDIPR
jgi:hypothetical protein